LDRTESCGHTFLTTDGGGHHLIGATGGLGERGIVNFPIAVANRFDSPAEEEVTVTGCLCTPFDMLGDQVALPRAREGDLIAVFCAGAYGLSASPHAWASRPLAREMRVWWGPPCPRAGGGAVGRRRRLSCVVWVQLAAPPQRKAADHRAHLVMEEASRRSHYVDLAANLGDIEPVERLHRAVRLALGGSEGGEVMTSD